MGFLLKEGCSDKAKPKWIAPLLFLSCILLFGVASLAINSSSGSSEEYIKELGVTLNKSSQYLWDIGLRGNLTKVGISGWVKPGGIARVFLISDTSKHLLFDVSYLNETPNESQLHFRDLCLETCALDGLSQQNYRLGFEIENTTLFVSNISYTIVSPTPIFTQETPTHLDKGSYSNTRGKSIDYNISAVTIGNLIKVIISSKKGVVTQLLPRSAINESFYFGTSDGRMGSFNLSEIINKTESEIENLAQRYDSHKLESVLLDTEYLIHEGYQTSEGIPVIIKLNLSKYMTNSSELAEHVPKEEFERAKEEFIFKLKKALNIISVDFDELELVGSVAAEVTPEVLDILNKLDVVERVFLDRKVHVLLEDSVDIINASRLWGLKDSDGRNITGENITIAIIDTGIDYTHPDLGGCFGDGCKVVAGYDFVNNDNDPMDDHGHGTHCAAIAASNGSLRGVAPEAKLYGYKVLDSEGGGYISDVISGIQRAVDPNQDGDYADHVDVISMSLGGWGDPDDPLSEAVDAAVDAGVVVVVAAGNSGPWEETIRSPGCARKALTVGATCKPHQLGVERYCEDIIARFSSRGPTSIGGIKPDVVAPGVKICAAQWDSAWESEECYDDSHVAISGTSMATPHVAGAAALLLQARGLNPTAIKSILMLSANDLGFSPNTQGAGLINLLQALNISFYTEPQSIGFGTVIGSDFSRDITIFNLRNTSLTLKLNVTPITDEEGNNYSVAILNETQVTLAAFQSTNVLLIINLTAEMGGAMFGRVRIFENNNSYFLPFSLERKTFLTVRVKGNTSLRPDIIIHNENLGIKNWALQNLDFIGDTYTFEVASGNYTAYALGDNSDPSLSYILMGQVEVEPLSTTVITLNLSDAREYSVKTSGIHGEGLKLYPWIQGFITYSSSDWMKFVFQKSRLEGDYQTQKLVYISDKPQHNLSTDILLSYFATPFDTSETPFLAPNTHYLVGFVLHNVNATTPTILNYTAEQLSVYNFTIGYPGGIPKRIFNTIYWEPPQPPGLEFYVPLKWTRLGVPFNTVFYVYGYDNAPQAHSTNWSFSYHLNLNYLEGESFYEQDFYDSAMMEVFGSTDIYRGVNPSTLKSARVEFGNPPYLPVNVIYDNGILRTDGPLMRVRNDSAYLYRYTRYNQIDYFTGENITFDLPQPRYEVYVNGSLQEAKNLTSGEEGVWDQSVLKYSVTSLGNYTINITIPSFYPVWNLTILSATFVKPAVDMQPPILNNLQISPRFMLGSPINVSVDVMDNIGISSVLLYYSTNANPNWTQIQLIGDEYGNFTIDNEDVDKVNIKLIARDTYNNSLTYLVLPASRIAENVTITLYPSSDVVYPGKSLNVSGLCSQTSGVGCYKFLLDYYLDGAYQGTLRATSYWWDSYPSSFSTTLEIPQQLSQEYVNISFAFRGTGIFSPTIAWTNVSVNQLDHDVGVYELYVGELSVGQSTNITVKVINNGISQETGLNLSLYVNGVLKSRRIIAQLNASQQMEVRFNFTPETPGRFNFSVYVEPVVDEDYLANNRISYVKSFGPDVSGWLLIDNWNYKLNESITCEIHTENLGDSTSNNITVIVYDIYKYTTLWADYDETQNVLFNGTYYNISVMRIDSDHAMVNISYSGSKEAHTLVEHGVMRLSNGILLKLMYLYSYDADILLGLASEYTLNMSGLVPYEFRIATINITPTELGWHRISLMLNTSPDSDYTNNYDYDSFMVRKDAPDVSVWLFSQGSFPVNHTSMVEASIYNWGYRATNVLNATLGIVYDPSTVYGYLNTNFSVTHNGITYNITAQRLDDGHLKLEVDYNGTNESINLSLWGYGTLSNGVILSVLDLWSSYLYLLLGDDVYLKNYTFPSLDVSDMEEVELNLTFNKLGYHLLKLFVNSSEDNNFNDNYDYTWAYVKKFGPDLFISPSYESKCGINTTSEIRVWMYNGGTQNASNFTLTFYDLYNYTVDYIDYDEPWVITFGGVNYTLYLTLRDDDKVRLNITYNNHTKIAELYEDGFVVLNNSIIVSIRRVYSTYSDVILGVGDSKQYNISCLGFYDSTTLYINWTPTVMGFHYLLLFGNASNEVTMSDNYYIFLVNVIENAPDLGLSLYMPEYIPVNKTTQARVRVSNNGVKNASNANLTLYLWWDDLTTYAQLNTTTEVEFNGTSYTLYCKNIDDTYLMLNLTYNGTTKSLIVKNKGPFKLENGHYLTITLYSYAPTNFWIRFAQGEAVYSKMVDAEVGSKQYVYFNITPVRLGQMDSYAYISVPEDADLSDNNDYMSVWVKEDAVDVKARVYTDYIIANNTDVNVYVMLENVGTKDAHNITIYLYLDGELYNQTVIELLSYQGSTTWVNTWHSHGLGSHNWSVVVTALNDIGAENNIADDEIYVYTLVNRTITLINSTGGNMSALVHLLDSSKTYKINGTKRVEIMFPHSGLNFVAAYSNMEYDLTFFESQTQKNLSAVVEFYPNIGYKHLIQAFEADWDFKNTYVYITANPVPEELDSKEVWIYGCEDWNFSSRNCESGWSRLGGSITAYGEELIAHVGNTNISTFALAERDTDFDGIPDSHDNDMDGDGVNNSIDNCPSKYNPKQRDVDGDGYGDRCDSDLDGDGIIDSKDPVVGLLANINSNRVLRVKLGNSTNLTRNFSGVQRVRFLLGNRTLLRFAFNFNRAKLRLDNLTIKTQPDSSNIGYVFIRGINLTGQNGTKTVTIDRKNSGSSRVCIKDAEVLNITELSSACDGVNETLILCDGTLQNGYNCTMNSTAFVVTGLRHSAVKEYVSSSSRRSSGGGASTLTGYVPACMPEFNCSEWGKCFANGTQSRVCVNTCTGENKTEHRNCTYNPCANGVLDEGESDVDCGGVCSPCPNGRACKKDDDCINKCHPIEFVCYTPQGIEETRPIEESCSDGIQNQGEEGTDCGGPCPPCQEEVSEKEPGLAWWVYLIIGLGLGSFIASIGYILFAVVIPMISHRKESKIDSMISQAKEAIQTQDIKTAVKLYKQIYRIYQSLPHEMKQDIHDRVMDLYYEILAAYHLKYPFLNLKDLL